MKAQALPLERIKGVETGGCPHTAIREDASINLLAVDELKEKFPDLELILIESGGDNLAATFSPELVDLSIYVIDVGMGGDIPRKGGPAITKSDFLLVNKTDLAPHVGVDLDKMKNDVESSLSELKSALESENVEDIKTKTSELSNALMKLGEVAYKNSGTTAENNASNPSEEINKDEKNNEDVVDADFEEVKPEDDKKNAS